MQQIQASRSAFAAIISDGSIVSWGHPLYGGDSRDVQDQLTDVQQIQAFDGAFAATRCDGSVVTWGNRHDPAVQLKTVGQIQASDNAFPLAALLLPFLAMGVS